MKGEEKGRNRERRGVKGGRSDRGHHVGKQRRKEVETSQHMKRDGRGRLHPACKGHAYNH